MSKGWYPVIDYEKCTECGVCTGMCPNGVYDKTEAPKPVVIYPEGCIGGCKGCGNACPAGSIEYFGDTGETADECSCGCGCDCGCGEGCC